MPMENKDRRYKIIRNMAIEQKKLEALIKVRKIVAHRKIKVISDPQFERPAAGPRSNSPNIDGYYEARRPKPRSWCKGRSRAAARRRARRS